MRFSEKIRQTVIACQQKCGGKIRYPFRIEPSLFVGNSEVCFGDCLNINFEDGPHLNQLGEVSQDFIPKKFIWGHSL